MPSYVARPHVLANKFVPGYLGDSFGLLPFVHGNPLANHFDGPFLVRLIRKEVTNMSGFPFGIEGRDPDIPSCSASFWGSSKKKPRLGRGFKVTASKEKVPTRRHHSGPDNLRCALSALPSIRES